MDVVNEDHSTLRSHFDEIAYQLREVRHRLDVRPQIAAHPIAAVAGALALGAVMGWRAGGGRPREHAETSRGFGGIVWSIASAIALRAIREVALQQIARAVKQQFHDANGGSGSERPVASA